MNKKIVIHVLFVFLFVSICACSPQVVTEPTAPLNVETETEIPTEEPLPATPTMTEAVIPTATPRTVLWKDDFSDVNSGWERYRQYDGVLDYGEAEEVYQMLVNAEDNLFWVMKDEDLVDVSLSVEAWQVGGPEGSLYGLMCRYDPNMMNGYFFLISSRGEAAVGTFDRGYQPIAGGELATFDAIQTGLDVKNTITASCTGDALTLSVNGEVLFDLPSTGLTGGDIGMAVATPMGIGADVYFDNLTIYGP